MSFAFITLEADLPSTLTLRYILENISLVDKPERQSFFNYLEGKWGQVFPSPTWEIIKLVFFAKIAGADMSVFNRLLANQQVFQNLVERHNQKPLLPISYDMLQPPQTGRTVFGLEKKLPDKEVSATLLHWFIDQYMPTVVKRGLECLDERIDAIRNGPAQMVIMTFINESRYTFVRTGFSYKGLDVTKRDIVAIFDRLERFQDCADASLVSVGMFTAPSDGQTGAAAAVEISASGGPTFEGARIIVAGACPANGKNTTYITANHSTCAAIAELNDHGKGERRMEK
ncbi:MAG: hypothetical protein Q9187_008239, partial [Circinaria calcarea]